MKILLISLVVITLLLLGIAAALLLLPLKFFINSKRRLVWIGYHRWMRAQLRWNDHLDFKLDLPFWHRMYPLRDIMEIKSKPKLISQKEGQSPKTKVSRISWSRMKSVLGAIRIRELKLNIDTDDFITNAYLVPVFQGIRAYSGHEVRINFFGRNSIKFFGETRLIKLLYRAWR